MKTDYTSIETKPIENVKNLTCLNCGHTGPDVRYFSEHIGGVGLIDIPHCVGQCEAK